MSEKRLSTPVVAFILAVLALPLLYFMTSGPALGFADSGRLGYPSTTAELLRTVYSPAVWIADDTFVEAPLKSYINWWLRLLEEP